MSLTQVVFLLVAGLRPVKDPLYLAASIAGVCNIMTTKFESLLGSIIVLTKLII